MGRKKKEQGSCVISVRVSDDEMEIVRAIMNATQKSASHVMREAIGLFIAAASPQPRLLDLP